MAIIAGNNRDRISVLQEYENTNNYSEREKTYEHAFYDRAEISFMSGTEKLNLQMSSVDRAMQFKVRFHLNRYTERHIIKWRGDYYNLRSIDPDKRRTYLIITGERCPVGTITEVTGD